ncbi:hypothetical protein HLH36_11285 [Gluconacetobacter aggeris]|uniref:Uncharacterized protein n=2 Tax=Gluconacetobacter TaxID=89583 RepID=A0A7W4IUG5_9PROT|nr:MULTISPECIES: hypothetical protein [Gluconacetobacter]MBB2168932.1 hypothetical protein [Gluconacetobacter aggeris]MBB2180292.1 hypothetical protein [Gluconacetobacter tumulicola]
MSFSINSTVREILADERAKAAVETVLPGFSKHPQIGMAKGLSLKTLAKFSGGVMTDEVLEKIDTGLKAL